jgi:hypothetical protein
VEIKLRDYIDNADVISKNLEYFIKHHGEIYDAYENFGKLIHEKGGPLDEKTRGMYWIRKNEIVR